MKDGQALISSESDIYIPLEINNIIKEKYIFTNLLKYIGFEKKPIGSSTSIIFEHIRDFGDPIEDWLPFLYQNWV